VKSAVLLAGLNAPVRSAIEKEPTRDHERMLGWRRVMSKKRPESITPDRPALCCARDRGCSLTSPSAAFRVCAALSSSRGLTSLCPASAEPDPQRVLPDLVEMGADIEFEPAHRGRRACRRSTCVFPTT
jgi:hypothetical protein